MTDEQLTVIYNEANGIGPGKAPPITTARIFAAMRAAHVAASALPAGLGAAIIPEGWQLVPKEPTAEMLNTFAWETPEPVFADRDSVHRIYGWAAIDKIYRAMLASAPKAPNA